MLISNYYQTAKIRKDWQHFMILEVFSDLTYGAHYAGKENSVLLTVLVTARDFDHKVPQELNRTRLRGAIQSEQLGRFEMKQSVMAITGNVRLLLSDG